MNPNSTKHCGRKYLFPMFMGLTLLLGACHSGVLPTDDELAAICPRAVRIMATVENYDGVAPLPRAGEIDGTVQDHDNSGKFQPNSREAEGGERAIGDIFLFAIPKYSQKDQQVLYFYKEGTQGVVDGKLSGTNIVAKPFTSLSETGEAVMELELKPGRYTFITVANSGELRKRAKDPSAGGTLTMDDLTTRLYPARAFAAHTDDLDTYIQDFPIVGQQEIEIPAKKPADPTQVLEPVIDMERVFARVDLYITTTQSEGGDYLTRRENARRNFHYLPREYRLARLRVLGNPVGDEECYSYPLLPSPAEYTSIKGPFFHSTYFNHKNIEKPLFETDKEMALQATWVNGQDQSKTWIWDHEINNRADGGLGKLWRKPILYPNDWTQQDTRPYHLYLPSLFLSPVNDPENKDVQLCIELSFDRMADNKRFVYRVPIKNRPGPDPEWGSNFGGFYNIRRNTIHDMNIFFYGEGLRIYYPGKVAVYPWRIVDIDLEIDPDDENRHEVNPVTPAP